MDVKDDPAATRAGLLFGVGAFLWWGFMPVYIKQVAEVPAFEVLAHRILWSFVFLGGIVTLRGRWGVLGKALGSRRTLLALLGSTAVIGFNWIGFIWAVFMDRILDASLGYYINPLVSILLGFVVLGERLRGIQWVALGLATAGVVVLTVGLGRLPWIALMLAFSFGIYGLFRKVAPVDGTAGTAFETALLSPLAIVWFWFAESGGDTVIVHGPPDLKAWLVGAGVVTAVPLILFSNAARRLPLSTIGFLQFIAPTMQLVGAVVIYGEAFTVYHGISFGLIWTALGLYTWDFNRRVRDGRRQPGPGPDPRSGPPHPPVPQPREASPG